MLIITSPPYVDRRKNTYGGIPENRYIEWFKPIARTYRKQCGAPKNESEMNTTNIRNLKLARPSNVINVNNVSNQFTLKSNHSPTFPTGLVEFFVKSFSNDEDLILDCFAGSGTVGVVCEKLNRNYILIDKEEINIPTIKKKG